MDRPVKPPFGKVIALQIVLTLAILINVFTASNAVRNIDAFLLAYPALNLTLAYVYIGCSLLTVIACYYLWQLKKFALYMLFVPIVTVILIDVYAGMPAQPIIAAIAQLLLILICLIPAWKYLR
jgi:hypothetical protein